MQWRILPQILSNIKMYDGVVHIYYVFSLKFVIFSLLTKTYSLLLSKEFKDDNNNKCYKYTVYSI